MKIMDEMIVEPGLDETHAAPVGHAAAVAGIQAEIEAGPVVDGGAGGSANTARVRPSVTPAIAKRAITLLVSLVTTVAPAVMTHAIGLLCDDGDLLVTGVCERIVCWLCVMDGAHIAHCAQPSRCQLTPSERVRRRSCRWCWRCHRRQRTSRSAGLCPGRAAPDRAC